MFKVESSKTQFQVGDMVRVIPGNSPDRLDGREGYIVEMPYMDMAFVQLDNSPKLLYFSKQYLELVATGKNDVPQRPGYTKVEYPGTAPLQPLADELAASWYPTEGSAYTADGIVWSTDNGLEQGIEKPASMHKCRCEITELMKQGCTCSGV